MPTDTPTPSEIAAVLTGIPVETIRALMEGRAVAVAREGNDTIARIARCALNEASELRALLGLNAEYNMAPIGIARRAAMLAAATETGSHE